MKAKATFLIAGAVLAGAWSTSAAGQAAIYPSKPVTIVVPYAAGGATDVIARLVGQSLSEKWKQPVVVNNKPGAGTVIGAGYVAKSPGDGYTLYMTTAAHTISSSLYKSLPYHPVKDFAPIGLSAVIPLVLVVGPALDVKDLGGLLAYGKANPGMTIGSPGNGSPQHLAGALFKERAKIELTHVPYKGDAPMVTDLISGQVQSAFITLSSALPHIKTGKIRPLALAHSRRSPSLPDVPTFSETSFGDFQAATWFGLFSPASVPTDLQQRIYKDMALAIAQPDLRAKLEDMGGDVVNLGPREFSGFIQTEVRNWSEAVRLSGAQVD